MRVILMAHGPLRVTDALVWSGEVPWPDVPTTGSGVRVPTAGIGGDVLNVSRVIYEPDGSVYLIMEAVDDDLSQNSGSSTTGASSAHDIARSGGQS